MKALRKASEMCLDISEKNKKYNVVENDKKIS